MLYEHFLDRFFRQVRIDRCPAKIVERRKRRLKSLVVNFCVVYDFQQGVAEFWKLFVKFRRGLFPFLKCRRRVIEK